MDNYQRLFSRLEQQNQGAFVPFVMLGDPDLATSERIIQTLIDNGADALELGIPYSDPVADGPTIQAAALRALTSDVTPTDCLALVARLHHANPHIPIGLLLYSNLVLARGIDRFYQDASAAGVDSVLIADVPLREAAPFKAAANAHGIAHIYILAPNADETGVNAIARDSEGYTYVLGRAGVTGADNRAELGTERALASQLNALKGAGGAPGVIGFGIASPEQVRQAIAAGAAGAIAGSATVNIIQQYLHEPGHMLQQLADFTRKMKAATQKD